MSQSTAVDNENNKPERLDAETGANYRQLHDIRQKFETSDQNTLNAALVRHKCLERASFHVPGHKGRFSSYVNGTLAQLDLTELPELDDLTYPSGVIKALEDRIARLYNVKESILSVSGASAALLACIVSVARAGGKILVPRNAHRAIIHGLVLSGLEPIWYEPVWNSSWGVYEEVAPLTLKEQIAASADQDIVAAVVVSPTFAGAISDIEAISEICRRSRIPLIVDEAHGAHLFPASQMPESACELGADLVAHSFHKTFGSLTQTGAVHVAGSAIEPESVRAAMRLVSSSSPSYVLLASIEQATIFNTSRDGNRRWAEVLKISHNLRNRFREILNLYQPAFQTNPLHLMAALPGMPAADMAQFLQSQGIYTETTLGAGCLFVLGVGTTEADELLLLSALNQLCKSRSTATTDLPKISPPPQIEQVVAPRSAYFAKTRLVEPRNAEGLISCDCVAPCPPGVPIVVPGSRITRSIIEQFPDIRSLRVMQET